MVRLAPAFVPTLGVTATLGLLWLAAVALVGPDAPAATVLDPGRTGSIGASWGAMLLVMALCLAVAVPEARTLAPAPAALLAGEVGEVHIHLAHLLATTAGAEPQSVGLKAMATAGLGAVAIGAVWRSRHGCCSPITTVALMAAGSASLALDALRGIEGGVWWGAAEEWSELLAYSILASLPALTAIKSRIGTYEAGSSGMRLGTAAPAARR